MDDWSTGGILIWFGVFLAAIVALVAAFYEISFRMERRRYRKNLRRRY